MTKHLNSYIPELIYGEHKHEIPSRICREDFAVIDPGNGYCILESRGVSIEEGISLPKAWNLPKREIAYLERELPRSRRALLLGGRGPVMVFGDLLDTTGLLFAVCPDLDVQSVWKSLRLLHVDTVAISPAIPEPDSSVPSEKAVEYIKELFYYMDRIFDTRDRFEIGLWTRTALISNFVGCRLQIKDLPMDLQIESRAVRERLTAFLICTFLSLRKMDGSVSATCDPRDPEIVCRVELNPEGQGEIEPPCESKRFLFLELPAFREFAIRTENGSLVLDAILHSAAQGALLHAEIPRILHWRMIFAVA